MLGFSEAETLEIRQGTIDDPKLQALTALAREITETRGFPAQHIVDGFLAAGYTKGALVDVIGLVALNTFTNYLNHIADTEVDFPVAPQLSTVYS
jgi:alkylhydroperoxidase family enzyme